MAVSFGGFNESLATFYASGALSAGVPVKNSANREVAACAAGNIFCGICREVFGSHATVQLSGYVRAQYSGTAPALGYTQLAADGSGGVKAVGSGGKFYTVIEVDSAASTVGFLLN